MQERLRSKIGLNGTSCAMSTEVLTCPAANNHLTLEPLHLLASLASGRARLAHCSAIGGLVESCYTRTHGALFNEVTLAGRRCGSRNRVGLTVSLSVLGRPSGVHCPQTSTTRSSWMSGLLNPGPAGLQTIRTPPGRTMLTEWCRWPCTQTAACPLSVSWDMSNAALPAAHPVRPAVAVRGRPAT